MNPMQRRISLPALAATLALASSGVAVHAMEKGVSDTAVRIGGVMDLEGRSRGLGQGMKLSLIHI